MRIPLLLLAFAMSIGPLFGQAEKKVLIIGIDGCRPDALAVANTPNLDGLIANGLYSPDALNDDITISGPGWSAILCGVWSDKHLVTGNNFGGNNYEEYPSIFKLLDEVDPDYHTVSICHWGPINDNIVQDQADFKLNVGTDQEVASQAANYLAVNDLDVVFLHFDDVDIAGHGNGFSPTVPAYVGTIETTDVHVGTVLQALEQRPNYDEEDWLILVSTDHGGLGTSHGGNSLEERNVFMIVSGDEVPQQLILRDSSLTAAADNCLGDTVELRFDEEADHVQISPNSLFDFGTDQDFTVECRVRTPVSGDVAIVGNKDWDSGVFKGFVLSFKFPNGPEWKVNIGDGSNRADINTGGLIADNQWHTLSVSFDRDGWMRMYEDGVFVDSTDISFIGDINTNEGLTFGADIVGEYSYTGAIAEVRMWGTILAADAIEEWHCQSVTNQHPNYDSLIGYWEMNEGEGSTTVMDQSIHGNNGMINGANWAETDSMVMYDYGQTPRLTDIVPSALTHLCIAIDEEWNLDGTSLVAECMVSDVEDGVLAAELFQLSPNPASTSLQLELGPQIDLPTRITIHTVAAEKVVERDWTLRSAALDISSLQAGIYLLSVQDRNGDWIAQKFVKS